MIPRHQLAVAPQITATSLARALLASLSPAKNDLEVLSTALKREFRAEHCILTDSGTSALVLGLRLLVGENGTVALPGYGCVDITSAVQFAGVKAVLYDVDPGTLSPDLQSVEAALRRGAQAILVAHYYGYPADVAGVRELACAWGVPVLEDAAQGAAGVLHGTRLGAWGHVSVLSFGRGKGLFGGHGGALLVRPAFKSRLDRIAPLCSRRGGAEVASAIVQWALGRPAVYAIPASIPWLHLGEMVYRPAHEPTGLSRSAATMVIDSLANEQGERAARVQKGAALYAMANGVPSLSAAHPIPGGESGYLRFAVLDRSGRRSPAPRLGVMRGYPLGLREQRELEASLLPGQPRTPGADELSRSLFTLPTHFDVTRRDVRALQRWMIGTDAELTLVDRQRDTTRPVAVPQSSR